MSAKQDRNRLQRRRAETGRALDSKRHERDEIRARKHDKKKRKPEDEARERQLDREIEALAVEERELTKRIDELQGRFDKLGERIADLARAIRRRRVVVSAGAPHWGGCEDIIRNEVVPVGRKAGVPVSSGKRSETYGNPTSDHHTSQLTASARDFATANDYGLRDAIMRKLGVGGSISDYGAYYVKRSGRTFRVQPIAGTHGTGPHLHIGVRLV